MEDGRYQGWKGMEDLDNEMEDGLSSFHLNCIIQLFTIVTHVSANVKTLKSLRNTKIRPTFLHKNKTFQLCVCFW